MYNRNIWKSLQSNADRNGGSDLFPRFFFKDLIVSKKKKKKGLV